MNNIVKKEETINISWKHRLLLNIALASTEEEKNIALKQYNEYIKLIDKGEN